MNPASPWHWKRYRFMTNESDFRPAVFNPRFPWWRSGETGDGASTIVAYLPSTEPLTKYWSDAYDVDVQHEGGLLFSSRFQKPSYLVPTNVYTDDFLSTEVRS